MCTRTVPERVRSQLAILKHQAIILLPASPRWTNASGCFWFVRGVPSAMCHTVLFPRQPEMSCRMSRNKPKT